MTVAPPTEKFINLQRGWPSPRLLPSLALHAAATATLLDSDRATESMLYGPSKGDPALRKGVAEWLSQLYISRPPVDSPATTNGTSDNETELNLTPISPERIAITNGASQNLASILEAFSDPSYTRRIWMVEPTYFHACTIFEDAGFQGRLVGVPEDEEGLDVEFLRSQIAAADKEAASAEASSSEYFKKAPRYEKLYRHIIYLVPTFSNPSAKTYPLARRESLVRLAREFDALLVTDDCYDFLSWTSKLPSHDIEEIVPEGNGTKINSIPPSPPPRLVDIDASLPGGDLKWGNAVSNGSFSKVIGPGLRCGWAEATQQFITRLSTVGASVSGGAPGQFSSVLIEQVLRTGALTSHICKELIPAYQSRSSAMRRAIKDALSPLGVRIDTGTPYSPDRYSQGGYEVIGGFFLYIVFPEGVSADEVARVALEDYNLQFLPAAAMAVRETPKNHSEPLLKRGARLCWAWEEADDIVDGVQRIARILKDRFP